MFAETEKATNVFLWSWKWKLQSIVCFSFVEILMGRIWTWLCLPLILLFIKKTQPNASIAK